MKKERIKTVRKLKVFSVSTNDLRSNYCFIKLSKSGENIQHFVHDFDELKGISAKG